MIRFALVRGLLASCLLISPVVHAMSVDAVKARLQEMSLAVRTLSYSGKLVYQRADVLANLAFEHTLIDGQERARLRRLSGAPLERSRAGDSLIQATPGPDVLRAGYPLPGLLALEAGRVMSAPYDLVMGDEERVAERAADVIKLTAADGHRYSYWFWVDTETALLLKAQTRNADGQILEQFEFSQIALAPQEIPLASSQSSLQVRVHPIAKSDQVMQFSPASWLPKGYQLVSALPSNGAGQQIYTLVYSDGLGSFSIFLELLNSRPEPDMQALLGPTVALGKDYPLASGVLRVTLVGEVPPATGKTIIDALDVDGLKRLLNRGS